jgi:ABC-type branched-subunit amino acid transport system substrate-binding protein
VSGTGPPPDPGNLGLPPVEVPLTRRNRLRRLLLSKKAVAVYLVLAAAITASIVVPIATATPPPKARPAPCHGGLVPARDPASPDNGSPGAAGTDCIGLTDGSQVLDPRLAGIERLILGENDFVQASGKRWVAIAYLAPITQGQVSVLTWEGVYEQLQGAYIAQWEANHSPANGDDPLVKLYLVNEGPDQGHWQTAVRQILAATGEARHVVAVAGLGGSVQDTRQAAQLMSDRQLAMFGTTITADNLNGATYASLVRIAPTNTDEVKAALAFLPRLPSQGATALLVADTDREDDYTQTWATQVQRLYPDPWRHFISQPETFNRALTAEGDRLVQISQVICQRRPDVVFFAGRSKDLELFVGALGANCADPVTVISGDSDKVDESTNGQASYSVYQKALAPGSVTLYSTALAHPNEWSTCGGPVPQSQLSAARAFTRFASDYATRLGPKLRLPLDDGSAMLAHDAIITAVATIRLPVNQSNGSGQQPYPYQEVTQNLSGLHDQAVAGVSGMITISNYGPSSGDPVAKPLVIVQHQANGSVTCKRLEIP